MLAKLFGSNARAKIIKQFFFHPEEGFYLRQLARDLNLQVNSVRRELENLLHIGLLSEQPAAEAEQSAGQEKKYYRVNRDFPLFEDMKALVAKSQILYKDDIIESLRKLGSIKLLVLAGIFVNNFTAPVDILIVGKVNREKLAKIISGLEKDLGREINFTLMNFLEFKYRRDITDVFIYDILGGEKIVVIDEIGLP